MKQVCLVLALASSFASASAMADSHRLAYSKAENIEIFVDHAANAPWCSANLSMRAVFGGAPDQSALGRLLPKIGVLLGKECPQATQLQWISTSAAGALVAQGASSKADGWAMQTTTAVAAVTPPAVAAPPVAPVAAPVAPAPAPIAASAPALIPTPAAAQVAAPAEPAPPTIAAPAPALIPAPTPAPVAAPAMAAPMPAAIAAPEPTAAPVAPVLAAPVAPVVPAVVVAAPVAPTVAPAPVAPPVPAPIASLPAHFEINGWAPLTPAEAMAKNTSLKVMQDQNGCKIISVFNLGDAAAYVSLKSEGLTCGPDGFATGRGRLKLERSDGARLAQSGDLWMASGFAFTSPVNTALLAHSEGSDTLWFNLGSDAGSRSHYLMRAERTSYGSGLDAWRVRRIEVVTDRVAAFRQAPEIKAAVDEALRAMQAESLPYASNVSIVFSDDFQQGIVQMKSDNMLYTIQASRSSDWKTGRGQGEWRYNLQGANNYVFQRDARVAREKRDALMRLASQERENLRQYQNLVEQAKRDPKAMLARLENNVSYNPFVGGNYARMAEGRKVATRMVVRVDGKKGDAAVTDWPYEMHLQNQQNLKSGWYLVTGEASLDPKQLDDKKLPLTLVTISKTQPYACQKDGCSELNEPLVGARFALGLPDWSPEKAQAVIDQATQL